MELSSHSPKHGTCGCQPRPQPPCDVHRTSKQHMQTIICLKNVECVDACLGPHSVIRALRAKRQRNNINIMSTHGMCKCLPRPTRHATCTARQMQRMKSQPARHGMCGCLPRPPLHVHVHRTTDKEKIQSIRFPKHGMCGCLPRPPLHETCTARQWKGSSS